MNKIIFAVELNLSDALPATVKLNNICSYVFENKRKTFINQMQYDASAAYCLFSDALELSES